MILSDRYRCALTYAFDLHRTQERNGTSIPYVAHLLGVSSLTLEYGGTEDCAIAGLLHDAAEDQGGLSILDEIQSLFGDAVANIVRECTDSLTTPRPSWHERKMHYVNNVGLSSAEGQLVSACDKLYNARAIVSDYRVIGEDLWQRFSAGRAGVLWYYRALTTSYSIRNPVVNELGRTVRELESLIE